MSGECVVSPSSHGALEQRKDGYEGDDRADARVRHGGFVSHGRGLGKRTWCVGVPCPGGTLERQRCGARCAHSKPLVYDFPLRNWGASQWAMVRSRGQ